MSEIKAPQGYWWEKPKGQKHKTVFGIARFLRRNQAYRREANLRHLRLYGNVNTLGLSAYNYSASTPLGLSDRLTYNLIQSIIDTKTNKIAKSQPKPTFLTSGGDYKKERKAKKLSRFSLGQLHATKMYEIAPEIYRHSGIFGTGAGKIYRIGAEIKVDITFIEELLVDDAEAVHGQPMNLYQEKQISREVLMRQYPEHAAEIQNAPKAEGSMIQAPAMSDMVTVVEAWHRATLDREGNPQGGWHSICIEGADLIDEEYTRPYFPFIFYRMNKPILGFFGQGSAERLTGLQIEINKLLRTIQLSFHLCGIPQYWFKTGSKNVKAKLNNEVGHTYTSTEIPTLVTPEPINPIFLQHFQSLIERGMQQEGVSELSAQSQKPAGLDSGKALREFNDIESDRFNLESKAYEKLFMEASRQFLDLGKEIAAEMKEESKDYKVKVHDRKFMESISWSEVDMSEDEYTMQMFPTSLLSSTPSGKLNDVKDLMQIGQIPPEFGLDLLDFPDLDAYTSYKNASVEDMKRTIEKLVDGDYQAPEPFQWLGTPPGPQGAATGGIAMMQSAYLKYKDDGLEENKLELMRRWMEEAVALITPPPPPAAPQGGAMPGIQGGQPTANPQAPQTSDMLPALPQQGGPQ
jgi:hypothetical protein